MSINNRLNRLENVLTQYQTELVCSYEAECDAFFARMTDEELETLAYSDPATWSPDYTEHWGPDIERLESLCVQAAAAGIDIVGRWVMHEGKVS